MTPTRTGSGRCVIVPTSSLADVAAESIAYGIERAIARTGRARVALAGGTTPRAVYRRLAQQPKVSWPRVEIYFGDERAVPPSDADSNYRMAEETLLAAVPIVPAKVHRMPAERADLDAAAKEYADELPNRLDLIILGVGAEGHVASLFPGAPALNEHERKVVPVDVPAIPSRRLTVTPPVIAAAREKIVIVAGSEKSAAVAQALAAGAGDVQTCPARLARAGTWLMDRAAAGMLFPNDTESGAGHTRLESGQS